MATLPAAGSWVGGEAAAAGNALAAARRRVFTPPLLAATWVTQGLKRNGKGFRSRRCNPHRGRSANTGTSGL